MDTILQSKGRDRQNGSKKKKGTTICSLQKIHLRSKGTYMKMKEWKMIFYVNRHQKRVQLAEERKQ